MKWDGIPLTPASGPSYRVKSYERDLLVGCSRGEAGTVGYTI
jgi:hypothetical protein